MDRAYQVYVIVLALSLLLSFGVGITFQILIPGMFGFIMGLIVLIGIFLALPMLLKSSNFRNKLNMGDFYDKQNQKFACTVCEYKHTRPICPKCGSNMRRPIY